MTAETTLDNSDNSRVTTASQTVLTSQVPQVNGSATRWLMIGLIAVVVGVGGFVGGMQYQKGQSGQTTANAFTPGGQQASSGGMSGQMNMNGSMGTVTAVSDTSITVNDQRAGASKTYSISSSTTVTDNGSSASVSDIAVGDTVMVQTSDSTSTAATSIVLNPTMGGPGGQGQNSQPATQSSGTSTSTNSI